MLSFSFLKSLIPFFLSDDNIPSVCIYLLEFKFNSWLLLTLILTFVPFLFIRFSISLISNSFFLLNISVWYSFIFRLKASSLNNIGIVFWIWFIWIVLYFIFTLKFFLPYIKSLKSSKPSILGSVSFPLFVFTKLYISFCLESFLNFSKNWVLMFLCLFSILLFFEPFISLFSFSLELSFLLNKLFLFMLFNFFSSLWLLNVFELSSFISFESFILLLSISFCSRLLVFSVVNSLFFVFSLYSLLFVEIRLL